MGHFYIYENPLLFLLITGHSFIHVETPSIFLTCGTFFYNFMFFDNIRPLITPHASSAHIWMIVSNFLKVSHLWQISHIVANFAYLHLYYYIWQNFLSGRNIYILRNDIRILNDEIHHTLNSFRVRFFLRLNILYWHHTYQK